MVSSVGTQIHSLLMNPILWACLCSWLCAQFLKTIIKLLSRKVNNLFEFFDLLFWRTGGMPSSHSAVVSCVCVSVGLNSGFNSDVFAVSFILFFITLRDALGVRRANGIHAKTINEIISVLNFFEKKEKSISKKEENEPDKEKNEDSVKDKDGLEEVERVKEVNGHSPLEVFVGVLLGLSIGILFSLIK